ncbi:MFS transporter [Saccharopolyspora sp. K220]|uniref:MFS transporter n=1 Tax=Saccharopolyspora soli TaxID=2926618 RepID=UPI001F5935D8|nr:MFS transporter [Saccharopolyspora soli]MCI2418141.1 MFS transporter [Saccharopolyspora soli]
MSAPIVLRHPQDVVNLVNSGRISGGKSHLVVVIALAGIFMDAYDFTSIAFGLSYVQEDFGLSPLMLGLTSGVILVGALLGSLTGGILMDRIGREKVFTADLIVLIIATILCAVAPNAWFFFIARFIMGLSVGIDYPVALSFVSEYSAQRNKGRALNMYAPVWYVAVGSTFVLLLAGYFLFNAFAWDIGELWRVIVAFGVVPTIIVLVLRRKYLTESPTWLAMNADLHRAAAVLRRAYKIDVVVAEDAVLRMPHADRKLPARLAFGRLWQGKYRMRTILSLAVNFCQGGQYYAVGFSIGVVTQQVLGDTVLTGIVGPLVFNLIFGVGGGALGVLLAPKVGVRRLALFGFCGTFTSLLVVNFFGEEPFSGAIWIAALFLGMFILSHASGPGTQGVVLATMSYPTSIRGAGVGFAQIGNRVGGTAGLVVWPVLTAAYGLDALLWLAAVPFLGLLCLLLIRWDPTHVDVDVDDYVDNPAFTDTTTTATASDEGARA